MVIKAKKRTKVEVNELNEELIARNERMLNSWLNYQEAVNALTDEALTRGYIQVAV